MRLIVTNGDAAAQKLRLAGLDADILAWRDVLHDGPVPEEEHLETLSQMRAAFIAGEFGMPHEEVALSFAERDAMIRRQASYNRVEIWLEHDLYDQLQLIQLLHFFAEQGRFSDIYLVQARDYLGTLEADAISALAAGAAAVSAIQFELACHAWRAFTSPDPTALVHFASHDTSSLPFLRPAVLRLLAEFPDPVRGLSLTEERVLRRLEAGPASAGELFHDVTALESTSFLGDASFFRRVDRLALAKEPLVEGLSEPFRLGSCAAPDVGAIDQRKFAETRLNLTEAGREVLRGALDHAMANDVDRWIGGIRLRPALQLRYDRRAGEMIAPR